MFNFDYVSQADETHRAHSYLGSTPGGAQRQSDRTLRGWFVELSRLAGSHFSIILVHTQKFPTSLPKWKSNARDHIWDICSYTSGVPSRKAVPFYCLWVRKPSQSLHWLEESGGAEFTTVLDQCPCSREYTDWAQLQACGAKACHKIWCRSVPVPQSHCRHLTLFTFSRWRRFFGGSFKQNHYRTRTHLQHMSEAADITCESWHLLSAAPDFVG